jgi:hypothetical protein
LLGAELCARDVRYWPKADMSVALHMSAAQFSGAVDFPIRSSGSVRAVHGRVGKKDSKKEGAK